MTLLKLVNKKIVKVENQLLYLIGIPGAGKTTLVSKALDGVPFTGESKPFVHSVYGPGCVMLGKMRGVFSGTDALSMSVSPLAITALRELGWSKVFGEGDRLASVKFFNAVQELGWNLRVLWLDTPLALAEERRARRAIETGSKQNSTWVQGRITKVLNVAERFDAFQLDGTLPVEVLAAQLRSQKVIRALMGQTV